MVRRRTLILRIALAGALVLLLGVAGTLLYTETATVRLTITPQRIETIVPLAGGQSRGGLTTTRFGATATESRQGLASTVLVSAAYATGFVLFTYNCTKNCVNATAWMPAGTIVANAGSFTYATQSVATINSSQGTALVPVRATGVGADWNSDPQTVTTIVSLNYWGHDLTVSNPSAISGGNDGHLAHVIQQSDYDVVVNTLTAKVNDDMGKALFARSKGGMYVGDSKASYTVTSDHNVGDEAASFTIRVSGTIGATAFSETQANAILLAALKARVPPGQQLTNDRIQYVFMGRHVSQPTDDVFDTGTDVLVTGTADGFTTPALTPQSVRSRIRGLSPAHAMSSLQSTSPGTKVEIRVSPTAMPLLPLIPDHIAVTMVVEPAHW